MAHTGTPTSLLTRSTKAAAAGGTAVPPAAAAFVERVSKLVGIPVWGTSWGAGRSQTVVSKDPFSPGFAA